MIIADISQGNAYPTNYKLYQYDYGRILRIQGMNLPAAVEIDFGLSEKGGNSIKRIGTTVDGVTDVPIPDSMLENNYTTKDYYLYAFIYLDDGTSGQTVCKITLKVTARPKPGGIEDDPEREETTFNQIMSAVNQIAKGKADTLDYKDNILRLMSGEVELSHVKIAGGSGGTAREIELQKSETAIQWRYTGEETWKDLVQLADIAGKDGITPHIGNNGNWYIGETDTGVKAEAPSTDSTLTESGKAADAAETGKKIGELKSNLSQLSEDKVTNPTSGAVGQILEIETVDENGKPKTYKAVDKPTGDGTGTGESYTLPVATSETLGGVKPVSKTDIMTQEVGVDSEGKLYTEPTTSSGGSGDGFIADGSITTEKIVDGAVTPEKTAFFDIVKSGTSVLKTLPDGSKSKLVDSTYYNVGARYGQNVFHVNLKAGKKYMIVQNETANTANYAMAKFNGSKPSADYTTDMLWLPLTDSDGNLTGEYSDAVITQLDTSQPSSITQWWTGEYNEYGSKTYRKFTYDDNGTTLKIIYYAFTIDKDFEGLISFSKNGAVNPEYVEILEFEDIDTAYNPLQDGFPVTSESTTKSEEYIKESYLEKPVKTIMRDNAYIVSPLNGLKWCALGDSLTDWGGGNCDIGNDADFGFITQIMRETGIIGTNKGYAGGHWTSDANETDGYTASSAVKNVNDIINGNVDYDIVTIAYGTNSDTNGDGTVEDAADQYATMCGAIKWCIEKLITWKPSLQIGIILPPQRADMGTSGNISMRTRGDLIKSVAELYSIPCCDMWRESGINTMTYKTTNSEGEEVDAYYYLSDGLHLGGENRDYNGYKKYGAKLKSFLESIAQVY